MEIGPVRYAASAGGIDIAWQEFGPHELKGVPEPWQIYEVVS